MWVFGPADQETRVQGRVSLAEEQVSTNAVHMLRDRGLIDARIIAHLSKGGLGPMLYCEVTYLIALNEGKWSSLRIKSGVICGVLIF